MLHRCLACLAFVVIVLAGCSPEASRARGTGMGADVGNTKASVQLHGDPARNNPSFDVPSPGLAPADAKGVAGWWAR